MSAKRVAEELQKGGLGNGCTVSPPPSGSGKGKGSKKNKSNKKPMTVAETRPTEQADEIIPATVDRDPKGIGVRGLGIAKRLSNEPVPAETQPVQTDPVSTPAPPKLSLKEQILKASQESGVSGIAVAVQEAKEVLRDHQTVTVFVQAVTTADALAIQRESFGKAEEQARAQWYALSFAEMQKELEGWAKGGDAATQQILDVLQSFQGSRVDVIGPLWRLVNEIVRPAACVRSWGDLCRLLRSLSDKGLLDVLMDRKYYPPNAVVPPRKGGNWHTVGYLPAMERGKTIPIIEAGWPFIQAAVKQANGVLDERAARFAELKAEDTGLTLAQAEQGAEGKIFLVIDAKESRGALLCIKSNRQGIVVRILRTVGGRLNNPPNWVAYDADLSDWPKEAADIFHAFEAWKQKG